MKYCLVLCLPFCTDPAAAQTSKHLLLAHRTLNTSSGAENFFRPVRAAGVGARIGLQLDRKRVVGNLTLRVATVQSGVFIRYEESGFNAQSAIGYSDQQYNFGYGTSVGLGVNGGYDFRLSGRSSIFVTGGLHCDLFPVSPALNGVQVNTERSGTGDFRRIYQEEITGFRRALLGLDASASYAFRIGRLRLFAGATYCCNPGSIRGIYRSFDSYPAQSSGTFSISRSAIGFSIGALIGGSGGRPKKG